MIGIRTEEDALEQSVWLEMADGVSEVRVTVTEEQTVIRIGVLELVVQRESATLRRTPTAPLAAMPYVLWDGTIPRLGKRVAGRPAGGGGFQSRHPVRPSETD